MSLNDHIVIDEFLHELSSKHEKNLNFDPIEIQLPENLVPIAYNKILEFLRQPRKRLFYFILPNGQRLTPNTLDHEALMLDNESLRFIARYHMLANDAKEQLSTKNIISYDPIKLALLQQQNEIQVPIQIQQSFSRPMDKTISCLTSSVYKTDEHEPDTIVDASFYPTETLNQADLTTLLKQLKTLKITHIEKQAYEIINAQNDSGQYLNHNVFIDGIIPKHMPRGFFIAKQPNDSLYLGYTPHPKSYPTLLAPQLTSKNQASYPISFKIEWMKNEFPTQEHQYLTTLLNDATLPQKKHIIIKLVPELKSWLNYSFTQPITKNDSFISLLIDLYFSGGRSYLHLFLINIKEAVRKEIDLCFLNNVKTKEQFLISPKAIKSLIKLTKLSLEQRQWWNCLTKFHITHPAELPFDFIHFFDAYTQVFLPKLKEKYLSLTYPCPINHQGHFLITLNRVLDVVSNAYNPTDQNLNLTQLDWGPLGAHFAITQASPNFKLVISEMNLNDDFSVDPIETAHVYLASGSLEPILTWGYCYLGQRWPLNLAIKEVRQLINFIKNNPDIDFNQKKHFIYFFVSALSYEEGNNFEYTFNLLKELMQRINSCNKINSENIFKQTATLYAHKQVINLSDLHKFITECIQYHHTFKKPLDKILQPITNCFIQYGQNIRSRLDQRIAKINAYNHSSFETFLDFAQLVETNQTTFNDLEPRVRPYLIDMLTSFYDLDFTNNLQPLCHGIQNIAQTKSVNEMDMIFQCFANINLQKSSCLPTSLEYLNAINILAQPLNQIISNKAELEKYILTLPGFGSCKFGEANIERLDDLIVEGLKDAVMKRIAIIKKLDGFRVLIDATFAEINPKYLPEDVKKDLVEAIHSLLEAIQHFVRTIEDKQPNFNDIHSAFTLFETNKQRLLKETFSFASFGRSHGKYLLSLLVRGDVDPQIVTNPTEDAYPGKLLTWGLWCVHKAMMKEIDMFFAENNQTHQIRDLTKEMLLDWLGQFNRTHSFTFFFKQELIEKKVVPMLEKTMAELDLTTTFKNSILEVARTIEPTVNTAQMRSDDIIKKYKDSLEKICEFLNLLIDLRNTNESQYQLIYKSIIPLEINYSNKILLVNILAKISTEIFASVLQLITKTFTSYPNAAQTTIEYFIQGIEDILALKELSYASQHEFLNMMAEHVMQHANIFPLSLLMTIRTYEIPHTSQSQLIYTMVDLIRSPQLDPLELSSTLQTIIAPTQIFLRDYSEQYDFVINLIKLIKHGNIKVNIENYREILSQLRKLSTEDFTKLCKILNKLISSHKHDEADIISITEITKQLVHFPSHLLIIQDLFKTQPYPSTSALNQALLTPGSEALEQFCESFDYNPFPNSNSAIRNLKEHFYCPNTHDVIDKIENLMSSHPIPDFIKVKLARQLSYIELLGFADPLNHKNYNTLNNLTSTKRVDLNRRACELLVGLREKTIIPEDIERTKLELMAYMREIYFRTTGKFPNTTQMLTLLISEYPGIEENNLLMQIKTGEGKSILTPMLALLQWTKGGSVDICTANQKLLNRDFENSYLPFFQFFVNHNEQSLIPCHLILRDSPPSAYEFNAIHCSTLEDMALFRLAWHESNLSHLINNRDPIHLVLDECDDALLDQTTLYKLVANPSPNLQISDIPDPHTWIYNVAYDFIRLPAYQHIGNAEDWDENEDVEQFKTFLQRKICELFDNDASKIIFINKCSTSQLRQWIQASCKAALLIENKHFVIQTVSVFKNDMHIGERHICVPLVKSIPKTGCCFTDGVQQALQVRCAFENLKDKDKFMVSPEPPVLASSSAYTLIQSYQKTKGRLLGISGTPGDQVELKLLGHQYSTNAIALPPHTQDQRVPHEPEVVHSFDSLVQLIEKKIHNIRRPITQPLMTINPTEELNTHQAKEEHVKKLQGLIKVWSIEQNPPMLIIAEDFAESFKIYEKLEHFKSLGFTIQKVTGKESTLELHKLIKNAGKVNTITIGTPSLSRGIDIDPNHPEGLFVFQTYVESPRITTQIAGRAARNGKKGHWLPIYLIPGPKGLWQSFLYYFVGFFFPRLKAKMQAQAIAELQDKIKQQAIVQRTYTQAIANIQEKTLNIITEWENFITRCLPNDPKITFQQFNWRQEFLIEMNKFQTNDLNEKNLQNAVEAFKSSIALLYQSFLREKWLPALEMKSGSYREDEEIMLEYLKNINLHEEFKTSTEPNTMPTELSNTNNLNIVYGNILSTYEDKAGAKLFYETINPPEALKLKRAQCRILLPDFIEKFCTQYPIALNTLRIDKNNLKTKSHLDQSFNTWIAQPSKNLTDKKLIQTFTEAIKKDYQAFFESFDELHDATTLKKVLSKIEALIIDYRESLKGQIYYEHFSAQKIFISFVHLSQLYGYDSPLLNELETIYQQDIMVFLAEYLIQQFAWVISASAPFYEKLENKFNKIIVQNIFDQAIKLKANARDPYTLKETYKLLKKSQIQLHEQFSLTIGHQKPLDVINSVIKEIDRLLINPFSISQESSFYNDCEIELLVLYHQNTLLEKIENYQTQGKQDYDLLHKHLIPHIKEIIRGSDQFNVLHEMEESFERLLTYKIYSPLHPLIKDLKKLTNRWIEQIKHNHPHPKFLSSPFRYKIKKFAELLEISENQICIQAFENGLEKSIQLHIESDKTLEPSQSYRSPFKTSLIETINTCRQKLLELNHINENTNTENIDPDLHFWVNLTKQIKQKKYTDLNTLNLSKNLQDQILMIQKLRNIIHNSSYSMPILMPLISDAIKMDVDIQLSTKVEKLQANKDRAQQIATLELPTLTEQQQTKQPAIKAEIQSTEEKLNELTQHSRLFNILKKWKIGRKIEGLKSQIEEMEEQIQQLDRENTHILTEINELENEIPRYFIQEIPNYIQNMELLLLTNIEQQTQQCLEATKDKLQNKLQKATILMEKEKYKEKKQTWQFPSPQSLGFFFAKLSREEPLETGRSREKTPWK